MLSRWPTTSRHGRCRCADIAHRTLSVTGSSELDKRQKCPAESGLGDVNIRPRADLFGGAGGDRGDEHRDDLNVAVGLMGEGVGTDPRKRTVKPGCPAPSSARMS